MKKKKHAQGKNQQSKISLPATKLANKNEPTDSTKDHSEDKMNPPEKRRWGLTRFEWIISILTLLGLVIAVLTGLIFRQQLHEMRIDQRAWISLSAGSTQFPKDETAIGQVPVSLPVTINNIGKTAAHIVHGELVMDYKVNGESPDFVYTARPRETVTVGMVMPNNPQQVLVVFSKNKPPSGMDIEPRFLSPYEYQALTDGHGYMVVYARVTYLDIFDTEHWTQFCTFFVAPNTSVMVTAKACTDYNDTDNNSG